MPASTKRAVTSPTKPTTVSAPASAFLPSSASATLRSSRSSSASGLSFRSAHSIPEESRPASLLAPPTTLEESSNPPTSQSIPFPSRPSDLSQRPGETSQVRQDLRSDSPLSLLDILETQCTNLRMQHNTLRSILPFSMGMRARRLAGDPRKDSLTGTALSGGSSGSHQVYAEPAHFARTTTHALPRSRSRSSIPEGTPTMAVVPLMTGDRNEWIAKGKLSPTSPDSLGDLAPYGRPGHAHRQSLTSLFSDVASVYFDADIDPGDEALDEVEAWTSSVSMLASEPAVSSPLAARREGASRLDDTISERSVPEAEERGRRDSTATLLAPCNHAVQRRTSLPAETPKVEPSLLSLMRKNVGKDFSTISVDVTFNEPISLLQRLAETVEYAQLLAKWVRCGTLWRSATLTPQDRAAAERDSIRRLALVTAFAVSSYANAKHRTSRKPFNPLMGETYELVRDDLGKGP